jgi:hypothetical protein
MEFFILFLITHLLGDYVFQPYLLSEKKKQKIKFILVHALIYTAISSLAVILIEGILINILYPIIIFAWHFLIDFLRVRFDKKFIGVRKQFLSFVLDQALHIVILFFLVKDLDATDTSSIGISLYDWFARNLDPMTLDYFLKLVLAYLIVLSPSSIFIKHFFNLILKKELCDDSENKVGSIIGKLERSVILTLGIMGLYTAIALVFTAKSIARYKQLEEKDFSEKYLIGTLLSLFIAILCIIFVRL